MMPYRCASLLFLCDDVFVSGIIVVIGYLVVG